MSDNEVKEALLVVDERCRLCTWVRVEGVCHRCGNDVIPNADYFHAACAAEYAAGQHSHEHRRARAAQAPPCPRFRRAV